MPAPAQFYQYGGFGTALETGRPHWRQRGDGLDEADVEVVDDSASSFLQGGWYSGYYIEGANQVRIGPVVVHQLRLVGVQSAKGTRLISGGLPESSLEGWDTAEAEWLTPVATYMRVGDSLSGYANMICTSAVPRKVHPSFSYYSVRASFKGLVSPKPVKRVVTVNGNVFSGDSIRVPLAGGWSDYRRASVLFPNIACTFSWMSIGLRGYSMPTQGGSPPGPLPQVSVPRFTGDGLMSHWPNGWRREGITEDQLPGTLITFNQETWAYQAQFTP